MRYDVECPTCGTSEVVEPYTQTVFRCPACGEPAKKLFSLPAIKMERDLNARQQAFIEEPETQAKLRSGEYRYLSKSDDASHV